MDIYKSLPRSIADNIKTMIFVEKKYNPGDKLPNERDLSAELNVGRSSLREALQILVAENVLVIKRGSGTYVSQTPGVSPDPLGLGYIKDAHTLLHKWVEVRMLLEPGSAKLAALNATDAEIEKIVYYSTKCQEILYTDGDVFEALDYDMKFHNLVAAATHNELIAQIYPAFNQAFSDSVRVSYANKVSSDLIKNMSFHVSIAKFIEARDADGAELSMRMHLVKANALFNKQNSGGLKD